MEPAEPTAPTETARVVCVCGTPRLMKVGPASVLVDMSDEYLYRGLRGGKFPGKRAGRGWLIDRDFIYGFLDSPNGTRFEDFAAQWMANEAQAVAS